MKGEIKPDHMPVNNYELSIIGLPSITALEISGLEEELITVQLPDRTVASGGQKDPTEFSIMIPLHHEVEMAAMENWFKESQDPVQPTYKKVGTLTHKSISGRALRSYTLVGVFPTKRKLPDLERSNEGDQAMCEWTLSVDDLLAI